MSEERPSRTYRLARRVSRQVSRLPVAARLVLGLAGLVVAATLLFYLPGMTTRPFGFAETMFTAVSAMTVTGLSIIVPASDLTTAGKVLLAVLIQLGGIGFMVLSVVVLRLLGRQISLVDRIALRNTLGALRPGAVLGLAARVLVGVFILEAAGTLLLWLNWREPLRESLGSDLAVLGYAAFHAISAFCNAGFDLFTGAPGFPDAVPGDGVTVMILSVLILSGGLGVPVWADLLSLRARQRLTLHTRITLVIFALLIGIGAAGLYLAERAGGNLLPGLTTTEHVGLAIFESISARTGGFSGVPGFEQLTPASQFLLMLLMFIGAAPASMGGGITTGTVAVLSLAMWAAIRNRPVPEINGRSISREAVYRATAVLIVSILVVTIAAWLLLVSHPGTQVSEAIFETSSAFATCGFSLGLTSRLNGFGLGVLMLVMFWGRLGALTIIAALARPAPKIHLVYPEEQILIG